MRLALDAPATLFLDAGLVVALRHLGSVFRQCFCRSGQQRQPCKLSCEWSRAHCGMHVGYHAVPCRQPASQPATIYAPGASSSICRGGMVWRACMAVWVCQKCRVRTGLGRRRRCSCWRGSVRGCRTDSSILHGGGMRHVARGKRGRWRKWKVGGLEE